MRKAITFGRYDLLTNAHLNTIETILKKWVSVDIGVLEIDNSRPQKIDIKYDYFYDLCDKNHLLANNIFTLDERIKMWEIYKQKQSKDNSIKISAIRRPEYFPNEFNKKYPQNEYDLIFPITTQNSEDFDSIRNKIMGKILKRRTFFVRPEIIIHTSSIKKNISDEYFVRSCFPEEIYKYLKDINAFERISNKS